MMNRLLCGLMIGLAVLMTGCATRTKMAFESDDEKLTPASKPIYLMTATIKNTYRTSYQPKLLVVHVEKEGAKDAADRLNFTMDDKARQETGTAEAGNSYLLRMPLDPGRYDIRGLTSTVMSFPINGFFFAPIHSALDVKAPGIYYLGHVSATVRERQGNEFKAGPTLPLIDQAVAGASGGTFDIEITDRFATDEPLFRSKFPALKDAEIRKAVLPGFDRAKAQKWWEAN
jgi:hypothetical protein